MNILLFHNPNSGAGSAPAAAEEFAAGLMSRGHEVRLARVGEAMPEAAPEALVVLGGDGSVHACLDFAVARRVPVHHVPLGTENLFARAFGMTRRVDDLLAALERRRSREIDVPACNSRRFVIMAGVGPDASVIARRESSPRRPARHAAYIRPLLDELLDPALAPIRVTVDGRAVVDAGMGWFVVANIAEYALGINPAFDADPADGLLDYAFFPATTSVGLLAWACLARLRLHGRIKRAVKGRGREIRVERLAEPLPLQLDGEAAGLCPTEAVFRMTGATLPVLR